MNKHGWLRIIEVSLAILIIFGVLLIVATSNRKVAEEDFSRGLSEMLTEASRNSTLRSLIARYNTSRPSTDSENKVILDNFGDLVSGSMASRPAQYSVRICDPEEICSPEAYPGDANTGIYADERIISPTPYEKDFSLKKIKIFLWK